MSTDKDLFNELLKLAEQAETPEDLQAVDDLLAELENVTPRSHIVSPADGIQQPPAEGADRWIVRTQREVAEFFDLHVQTVKQWWQETPPPPGEKERWPVHEIARWRISKFKNSDVSQRSKEIDNELKEVSLESKRLELAREKRLIVELADVELWAADAIVEFREIIMSLPDQLATSVPPEIREVIHAEAERKCRAALITLERRLQKTDAIQTEVDQPASSS